MEVSVDVTKERMEFANVLACCAGFTPIRVIQRY